MVQRTLRIAASRVVVMVGVATLVACSGDKKEDPAIRAVCATRPDVQAAVSPSSPGVEPSTYPRVIEGLNDAVAVAPEDIAGAFVTARDALAPLVDLYTRFNGDLEAAKQDPQYASIVNAVQSAGATNAGVEIAEYYDEHC